MGADVGNEEDRKGKWACISRSSQGARRLGLRRGMTMGRSDRPATPGQLHRPAIRWVTGTASPNPIHRPQTHCKADLRERAFGSVWPNIAERTAWLPVFQTHYNARRPDPALGQQPPASRLGENNLLQLSRQEYRGDSFALELFAAEQSSLVVPR